MRSLFLFLFLSGLTLACGASGARSLDSSVGVDDVSSPATLTLAELWGGERVFRVTEEWDHSGEVGFPMDPVPDEHYVPVSEERRLDLRFSEDGVVVEIGDGPLVGDLQTLDEDQATWELGDGTFAGGRFQVWIDAGALHAALTIYGSGVPIVSSERGLIE
jgi:hypothetical protein